MTYQVRPAARTAANPLIGLYGLSGSGKTYSSLLLARGLAGPDGKIIMIDTESGRGELYSDVIPGGYDVIHMDEPFSPDNYVDAIKVAEQAGAAVIIVDSGSHEWEGAGGVRDQAAAIEEKTGKSGLHCWNKPKQGHQRLVLHLLRNTIPVIVCLRAKYKSRQGKDNRGKTVIVRDDHTSPIQAEDFIYEMTVHAEVQEDHTLRVTKTSHPDLGRVFQDGKMITVETGAALRAWAQGGAEAPKSEPPALDADVEAGARQAASQGTTALQRYWNKLDKPTKAALKPLMDAELKPEAKRRDAEKESRDIPDESRDLDPEPQPAEQATEPEENQPEVTARARPNGENGVSFIDQEQNAHGFASIGEALPAFTELIKEADPEIAAYIWQDNRAFRDAVRDSAEGTAAYPKLRAGYRDAHGDWPPKDV